MDNDTTQEELYDIEEKAMRDKYRALFATGTGRDVLMDILLTCHLWGTLDPDNKAQIAEYNVGVVIAAKAGFLDQLAGMLGLPGIQA